MFKISSNSNRNRYFHKKYIILLLFLFVFLFFSSKFFLFSSSFQNIFKNAKESPNFSNDRKVMSVHVLDVQKQDAIYINCNNKHILIDSGEYSSFQTVDSYLKKHNVKKFDLIVATHPHTDHMGSMSEIIKNYKIEKFLMPQMPYEITPTFKSYKLMLQALEEKNVLVLKPNPPEDFQVGDMFITIFAPNKEYKNTNNNSIVMSVAFKNKKILFTGDAEKESEHDIMKKGFDIKANILKVAHHGSNTSTTTAFLKSVSPEYAVLSTSDEYMEKFGFKEPDSIKRLESFGVKIFRTDLDGTVIFRTDGEEIKVECEKERKYN
jgi:competence protein ComEC